MRSYKTVILEAELLASPPEAVAAFLKDRSEYDKNERRQDEVDKDLEAALLARNDPLINLALARFGYYPSAVRPLFEGAAPSSALRLAALSNPILDRVFFSDFPLPLFDGKEKAAEWLASAPDDELGALFRNPQLGDSFLRDMLERKSPWDSLPEERLAMIVALLSGNERMARPYDDSYMDGYAEYSHNAVFDAAWKLAETAPVTELWARPLGWLYDSLSTSSFSVKEPLEIAARWVPDPSDEDFLKEEAKQLERGWLVDFQLVRKGLARLALRKNSKLLEDLLASQDPAFRSAAYSEAALKPEQILKAYEKDGELLFNQAIHNLKIWRTPQSRDALREVAWAVVNNDKLSDLSAANIYNGIRDDMAKKHPEWFAGEEDIEPPEPSDEPATKADLRALAEMLINPSSGQSLAQLKQALQVLHSRVGWIWWFSLGALAASLKHF